MPARLGERPGEKARDLGDDIGVTRVGLHGARFPLHVHHAQAATRPGHGLPGAGRAQGVDIVDHVGAGG
jgi:hypothetical protein